MSFGYKNEGLGINHFFEQFVDKAERIYDLYILLFDFFICPSKTSGLRIVPCIPVPPKDWIVPFREGDSAIIQLDFQEYGTE